MNPFAVARDLLLIVILGQVFGLVFFASLDPENFGRWLQKIDNGRFEMLECDCTVPLD